MLCDLIVRRQFHANCGTRVCQPSTRLIARGRFVLINFDKKRGFFAAYKVIISVRIVRTVWGKKNYVHAVTGADEYSHCEWMTRRAHTCEHSTIVDCAAQYPTVILLKRNYHASMRRKI